MRAEDHRSDKTRPFTGAEYLESLRDGREVYINGERIADVTSHPAMRNSARSIARMYDALHDPKRKERLTSPTDTGSGGYTHKYFRVAHSAGDLVAHQRLGRIAAKIVEHAEDLLGIGVDLGFAGHVDAEAAGRDRFEKGASSGASSMCPASPASSRAWA